MRQAVPSPLSDRKFTARRNTMDSASLIAPVPLLSTVGSSNAPNLLADQFISQDGSGNHDVGEPAHHSVFYCRSTIIIIQMHWRLATPRPSTSEGFGSPVNVLPC